jgi:hypothetical protein
MALSADYFLKYLWWSAFYSGSSGFGSHSQQVQNAFARSTTYLWIVIVLELITLVLVWSAMKPRANNPANLLGRGVRVVASLTLTIAGTALLAFVLAWIQPGIR